MTHPASTASEMNEKNGADQTVGDPEASDISRTPIADVQRIRGVRKQKKKPKRPPTGFNLFAAEVRPIYRREHPQSSTADIERMIGLCWGGMTDKHRRPYIEEADPECKRGMSRLFTPVKKQHRSVDAVPGFLQSPPLPPTPQATASSSRTHSNSRARIGLALGERGERFLTELTRDIMTMHTRQQELQNISDEAANNLELTQRTVAQGTLFAPRNSNRFEVESSTWLESAIDGIEADWFHGTDIMHIEDDLFSMYEDAGGAASPPAPAQEEDSAK